MSSPRCLHTHALRATPGLSYPGPCVMQLLAMIHFFGSKRECVTVICDTEAPRLTRMAQAEAGLKEWVS